MIVAGADKKLGSQKSSDCSLSAARPQSAYAGGTWLP